MDKAAPKKPPEDKGDSYSAAWNDPKLCFAGISATVLFVMASLGSVYGLTETVLMIFASLWVLLMIFIYIYMLIKDFSRKNLCGIFPVVFLGGFFITIVVGLFLLIIRQKFGVSQELELFLVIILGIGIILASYLKIMRKKIAAPPSK